MFFTLRFARSYSQPVAQDENLRRITVSNDDGDVYIESSGDDSEIVLKTEKVRVDGDVYIGGSIEGLSQKLTTLNSTLSAALDAITTRLDAYNTLPEPPVCKGAGAKKLTYNGSHWDCQCAHEWSGSSCSVHPSSLYKDDDDWFLLLDYRVDDETVHFPHGVPPVEPFAAESSSVWLNSFNIWASDVQAVRFFCNTTAHDRVIHFSVENDWIRRAVLDGSEEGNDVSYWINADSVTKYPDHNAFLPDATTVVYNSLFQAFGSTAVWDEGHKWYAPSNPDMDAPRCDDSPTMRASGQVYNHQIWVKLRM